MRHFSFLAALLLIPSLAICAEPPLWRLKPGDTTTIIPAGAAGGYKVDVVPLMTVSNFRARSGSFQILEPDDIFTTTIILQTTLTADRVWNLFLPDGNSSLTLSGNFETAGGFSQILRATGDTDVTLPTSGTLYSTLDGSFTSNQLATSLTDESGTGVFARTISPVLVTPSLGAATATTINGVSLTGSGTIATGAGFTFTVPATGTAALLGASQTFTGVNRFNGDVGMGTGPLLGPLHIDKGASVVTYFRIGGDGTATKKAWNVAVDNTSAGELTFGEGSGGGVRVTILQSGQVGIGMTPTNTLDVSGTLGVSGIATFGGDVQLTTAGRGLYVKEGTNCNQGVVTLVAGTATVSTTEVTSTSRIFLTVQSLGTVSLATPIAVTARTDNMSFTITSASITDTSVVAWEIFQPAP